MPNFKYTDDETRVYNDFGIVITGRVVEAAAQPDPRWEETTDAPTDPPKAPGFLTHGSPYEIADEQPEPAKAKPTPVPPAPSASPASEPTEPPAPSA